VKYLLTALLAVALLGCSAKDNGGTIGGGPVGTVHQSPPGQLHGDVPPAIAAAGQIRIGAAFDRAPLLFYSAGTTTPLGIEVEVLQAIGRQLGVRVTFVNLPLGQLGPALLHNQIDVLAGGFVDIKGFEGAGIDFVDDLIGRSAVLVRQGNPDKISGPLDLCGFTVAYVAGTAQQGVAQQAACPGTRPLNPRPEGTHAAVISDLVSGKANAVLDDAIVADYSAQASTGAGTIEVVGSAISPMPYGIGVAHTDPALLNVMQAALLAIVRDGEYDAALSKWGAENEALRVATINGGS
jgi:ABC-type amino acid transport substrate-binding protein